MSGKTEVMVPVEFVATYEDGRITKMAVMPQESNAGYFGSPSMVFDSDDPDADDPHFLEHDGPFWNAMRDALGTVPIEWEE